MTRALACSATFVALLALACAPPAPTPPALPPAAPPLIDLVDPTIGTGGFGFRYGATFLGAAAPHGLVKVGPDTTGELGELPFVHFSGNWANDPTILCFSHVHLHGTGLTEGGVVALMPTTSFDPARRRATDYAATRIDEQTAPGSYRVTLAEPEIDVELAASVHTASHRITFPDDTERAVIVLDLDRTLNGGEVHEAELTVEGARVTGRMHTEGNLSPPGGYEVFFVLEASAPFTALVWSDESAPATGTRASGKGVGMALDFGARGASDPVLVRVGLSLVDGEGALRNLEAERPDFDFDAASREARDAWHELLSRVRLFGGNDDEREIFASALYRSFLMPTVQSDVDGRWRGPDGVIREARGFRMMTDLSLWDTYRTVHPLYALLAPESARDAALSLVAFTEAGGFLPKWPMATGDASVMVGSPGEIVLADALARGVLDAEDLEPAWPFLRAAALDEEEPPAGRGGRNDVVPYDRLGYVPAPLRGPVSTTLEYALADQALARIASALGHDDDAARLRERARGWRALFDPETRFLRAKDEAGAFVIAAEAFDPERFSDDYVEANAWQSSFPYDDVEGLASLHGSKEAAAAFLSEMFEATKAHWDSVDRDSDLFGVQPLPYHWQGNEPSIHVPALAYELDAPDLAHAFVRWTMTTQYGTDVDGIPGNDDGGALSAWWVLAALGLHAIPGGPDWVLGTPLFPRVELDTPEGTLVVTGVSGEEAAGAGRVTLDGETVDSPRLEHARLIAGKALLTTVTTP